VLITAHVTVCCNVCNVWAMTAGDKSISPVGHTSSLAAGRVLRELKHDSTLTQTFDGIDLLFVE